MPLLKVSPSGQVYDVQLPNFKVTRDQGGGYYVHGRGYFIYFKDPDGFLIECCSELAKLGPDSTYELGRKWTVRQTNLWGRSAPPAFLLAGRRVAPTATPR